VYFPLDVLTGHAIIFGKTRTGKSFMSLLLIQEALANGIRVRVFDPHGTLADRLAKHELLDVVFTQGKADITSQLEDVYEEASAWKETNELGLQQPVLSLAHIFIQNHSSSDTESSPSLERSQILLVSTRNTIFKRVEVYRTR